MGYIYNFLTQDDLSTWFWLTLVLSSFILALDYYARNWALKKIEQLFPEVPGKFHKFPDQK